jgi:hypothetical protein
VAERWGYTAVFVLSGIGRLGAALLFARFAYGQMTKEQEPLTNDI